MATFYIDPNTGTGSGIGSFGDPFAAWSEATITSDNTYLQNRGTIVTEQVTLSEVDNVILGAYGSGADPIIDAELTRDYCIKVEASNSITIGDIETANGLINCVIITGLTGTWTGPYTNFILNNVTAHGCLQATSPRADVAAAGTGILLYSQTNYNLGTLNTITLNNCTSYNNAFHGFDTRNKVLNVTYNNCVSYGNGTHLGAHNFSTHPSVQTTTWSATGGGVYNRTEPANDNYQYIIDAGGDQLYLVRNDSAGSSPQAGEWSKVAKEIYIHLAGGGDPSVVGNIFVVREEMGPVVYNDCLSYGALQVGGSEGHGFASDDSSYGVSWNGCISYSNEGSGFKSRFNYNVNSVGCISYDNREHGWRDDGSNEDVNIYNCTSAGNGGNGIQLGKSRNSATINNISSNNGIIDVSRGGISETGSSITTTVDYNVTVGNTAFEIENESGSNNSVVDPLFNSDYTLQSGSPCIGTGTNWWPYTDPNPQDPNGNYFWDAYVDIGGYSTWDGIIKRVPAPERDTPVNERYPEYFIFSDYLTDTTTTKLLTDASTGAGLENI